MHVQRVPPLAGKARPAAAETLRRLAGDFGRPVTDPASGRAFQCDDPATVARLESVAARIEAPVDLPRRAPQAVRVSVADAIPCIFAQVAAWAGRGEACAKALVAPHHLGLAFALELLIPAA